MGQSWDNRNTLVGSDMWGNPCGCFAWSAVEKVGTWEMALVHIGTPSTRAVSVSPPKFCSVIMVITVFYPCSPFPGCFVFFFPLRWCPALCIIIWVWSHPWIIEGSAQSLYHFIVFLLCSHIVVGFCATAAQQAELSIQLFLLPSRVLSLIRQLFHKSERCVNNVRFPPL